MSKEQRINQYQRNYLSQYGFEAEMVKYRHRLLMERLRANNPQTVIEVGCGAELLYGHYIQAGESAEQWLIVEPGNEFYDIAANSGLPNLTVLRGFFEEMAPQIRECMPKAPDMIIMSSVLHEVAAPGDLLKVAVALMDERSALHVSVPNATSMHRMLAKSMGLINDLEVLSTRNLELLQRRVYDLESLRKEIETAGLSSVSEGGYLVKPFTHEQMQSISPYLGEEVLDGLYQLGKDHQSWASEIYLEARKL